MPAPHNHGPGWVTGHRLYQRYVDYAIQQGQEAVDYEDFIGGLAVQTKARVLHPTQPFDRADFERLLGETSGPVIVRHPSGEDLIIGITPKGESADGGYP